MNKYSRITIYLIVLILILIRLNYSKFDSTTITNVLTWDAFGYYLILPAQFIYRDVKKMQWVEGIVQEYKTTGSLYQLAEKPNGNRVMKYLLGISIMYAPFFFLGHLFAGWLDLPQDGFSSPYQVSISLAAIFYAFIGLLILRRVLLKFFTDHTNAITLLVVALATNYAQYVAVDSGQTHGYIFTQYAILLYLTIRWHEKPNPLTALSIGLVIGLGVISRPTEIVMLFIPLLYNTYHSIAKKEKWALVNKNKSHVAFALAGGFIGVLPQLLYWKIVTGNWVYDVGSKWTFFQPNWQVLFGWEKGWFIYTPVVILMVAGLFYFRRYSFYWSVLIYFLLNTWIIIAWDDWHYGASYSSRALVQSYAVMSLPLAVMIQKLTHTRMKIAVFIVLGYLTAVNLFQIWQYNKTILHYNSMNRRYYQAIYMNPNPSPAQMSLLDTDEFISNERRYRVTKEIMIDTLFLLHVDKSPSVILFEGNISDIIDLNANDENWIKFSLRELSDWGAFDTYVIGRLEYNGHSKTSRIRMQNGLSKNREWNRIEFYFRIPDNLESGKLSLTAETKTVQDIYIKDVMVTALNR